MSESKKTYWGCYGAGRLTLGHSTDGASADRDKAVDRHTVRELQCASRTSTSKTSTSKTSDAGPKRPGHSSKSDSNASKHTKDLPASRTRVAVA